MQGHREAANLVNNYIYPFYEYCTKSKTHKLVSLGGIGALLWLLRVLLRTPVKIEGEKKNVSGRRSGKGEVDRNFFKRLFQLLKIVVPSWRSKEVGFIVSLTVLLFCRTLLSIYIASVNGRIVKAIVNTDLKAFLKRILTLTLISFPSSFITSGINFFNKRLSLCYRERLTHYIHNRYIKDLNFYKITNLDSRIATPDQRITQDVDKWATCFSQLYADLSKPILDIILFSRKLAIETSWQGPAALFAWYFISGLILRFISPAFGKLTATQQKLEGDFRHRHNDLINHSEEIAFFRGSKWERLKTNKSLHRLLSHILRIMNMKIFMGTFDGMLVKYGVTMVCYSIMAMPVFGSKRDQYLKSIGNDMSTITRDYIRNSSLLVNLAKATGKFLVSYKTIQQLAGYTSLISELRDVLDDLKRNKYTRKTVKGAIIHIEPEEGLKKGILQESENISFEDVPIITPNGDTIVNGITFKIKPTMNCVIVGPNGCGKSSLFRILGELWPIFGGQLHKPKPESIFYIPQRPYLPVGTLRDQIIYPHSVETMIKRGWEDQGLTDLLKIVELQYIVEREKDGYQAQNDWNDLLSGGEKQRIAMARLFYHSPKYAILDECTSQVTLDIEAKMYTHAKVSGITLLTVSHRQSLWKYHEYMLRFDGEGNYRFGELDLEKELDHIMIDPAELKAKKAQV